MPSTLLRRIEDDLAARRPMLHFSPALEARFEADTGARRNRHLVLAGLVALAIYDLFLFNDYTIRPEVFSDAVFLRLCVMTPYGALILWSVRRGLPPALREALMASNLVVAMVVACRIFFISSSPHTIFDPFSFGLIILAGNIVFSLRFAYALASTLISLAVMAAFLWQFAAMSADVKAFALLVTGATGVFTLFANYRLEASERKSYLLLLRETLRASSALEDNRTLTRISYTDPLTKLPNRRQFDEAFSKRWDEACVRGSTLGLLMIDVDDFKPYNDYYGHPQGDACLVRLATALERQVRSDVDLVARLGGEEFAMLLPGSHPEAARLAAERVRSAIEALAIPHNGCSVQKVVTVSIGVAVLCPKADLCMDNLHVLADQALYQAKRNGRNQVAMVEVPGAEVPLGV